MRILLVHSYYRLRGGEDVVFEAEANMLESFGHEVFRYTRRNEDLVAQGRLANFKNTIWNREVADDITRLIRSQRIDVAHFHNTFPAISPLSIRAAHRAGAVTVQTLHNSRPLCAAGVCYRDHQPCTACIGKTFALPAIQHACFHDSRMATSAVVLKNLVHRAKKTFQNYLDVAIAPTKYVRDRYVSSNFPFAPIVVKPHFIDVELATGAGRGGYALFVGRLSEEKGLRTLLEAWPKLRGHLPLKIIGKGPLENEVRDVAANSLRHDQNNPPCNAVEHLGQLDQHSVYDAIGDAAVLILPSHCAESFGRVVIEAYAKGTPVVCANQGGQAELVHPGVGGTFQSGDADDLARVIDSLITLTNNQPDAAANGPGRYEVLDAMRPLARLEYEQYYTAAINHDRLQQIYTNAIAKRWPDRHHSIKDAPLEGIDTRTPHPSPVLPTTERRTETA